MKLSNIRLAASDLLLHELTSRVNPGPVQSGSALVQRAGLKESLVT